MTLAGLSCLTGDQGPPSKAALARQRGYFVADLLMASPAAESAQATSTSAAMESQSAPAPVTGIPGVTGVGAAGLLAAVARGVGAGATPADGFGVVMVAPRRAVIAW